MPNERYDDTVNTDSDWMGRKGIAVIPAELWTFLTEADRKSIIQHVDQGRFPCLADVMSIKKKAEFLHQANLAGKDIAFEIRVRIASSAYALTLDMEQQSDPEMRKNARMQRDFRLDALCIALEEGHGDLVLPDQAQTFMNTEGAAFYQACEVRRVFEE